MTSFNEAFYEEFPFEARIEGDAMVDEHFDEVADTLDVHERLDGAFDVVELMYDGTTRMVTKSYDPMADIPF